MVAETLCRHDHVTIEFERGGTRLHPKAWMVERCENCHLELDRRSVVRSWGGAGAKGD